MNEVEPKICGHSTPANPSCHRSRESHQGRCSRNGWAAVWLSIVSSLAQGAGVVKKCRTVVKLLNCLPQGKTQELGKVRPAIARSSAPTRPAHLNEASVKPFGQVPDGGAIGPSRQDLWNTLKGP